GWLSPSTEILELLLAYGADPNRKSTSPAANRPQARTPLQLARIVDHERAQKLLLAAGAEECKGAGTVEGGCTGLALGVLVDRAVAVVGNVQDRPRGLECGLNGGENVLIVIDDEDALVFKGSGHDASPLGVRARSNCRVLPRQE